jgi:hypothetical protein
MNTQVERDSIPVLPDCFYDEAWLTGMMKREKRRRGANPKDPVFVGVHNVAQWWWCGMYSLIKSSHNELGFFSAYLADRVEYSLRLGFISSIPKKAEDLLFVGENLTLRQVEALHLGASKGRKHKNAAPNLQAIESKMFRDNYERGLGLEAELAERHPTFRWNFEYESLVAIGIPDGITKTYIYEFKAINKQYFISFTKPVAFTQADIYGLLFKRKKKRVDIYIKDADAIEKYEANVDLARAKETLRKFIQANNGQTPQPPARFKCLKCEYRRECSICQT